jgi:predicted DNA-binding transcriptional regulator AlpA
MPTPTQTEFDKKYISSSEIMSTCGVTRTAVFAARKKGKLPDPIYIQGQIYIWERAMVQDYLNAWRIIIDTRRATTHAAERAFIQQ